MPIPLTMTHPRKCVADRRGKLTDEGNQRLNHNQERGVGPEPHGVVANLEHCPKPVESPTPPYNRQILFLPGQHSFPVLITVPLCSYGSLPYLTLRPFNGWLNLQTPEVGREHRPAP